ncbi:hypothetical protein ElyMa_004341000 [Elysia marginata]|uniref:Uncharacterized protein n=1 Tax=Elysia marginata TaxID=1093978 RepID=A0AAV4H1Q6_9GAST|nr:hypothetical protein ElyMa_004341000 [Elysia marginata]
MFPIAASFLDQKVYWLVVGETKFNSLSHMWSDHRLSRNMKIKQASLISLYVRLTDSVIKSVKMASNSRCLSVTARKELKGTASRPEFNLVAAIARRRLRFAGHTLRMDPDRLLRRLQLLCIAYLNS